MSAFLPLQSSASLLLGCFKQPPPHLWACGTPSQGRSKRSDKSIGNGRYSQAGGLRTTRCRYAGITLDSRPLNRSGCLIRSGRPLTYESISIVGELRSKGV